MDIRTSEQKKANKNIHKTFKTKHRAQVVATTALGKTRIAVEAMPGYRSVVMLAPKADILKGVVAEYVKWVGDKRQIAVLCSEKLALPEDVIQFGVASGTRTEIVARLRSFLSAKRDVLLLSTYQSQGKILEAMKGLEVDLLVCDEAHRTAGDARKLWGSCVSSVHHFTKRLFLTATARTYAEHLTGVRSQDDEDLYGPIVYSMSNREARERGLVNNFEMHVPMDLLDDAVREYVLSDEAKREIENKTHIKVREYEIAMIGLVLRECRRDGYRKILIYSNTKRRAQYFALVCEELSKTDKSLPKLGLNKNVWVILGGTRRDAAFKAFQAKPDEMQIISSCRALTEGVNLVLADTAVFMEWRSSEIDIQQTVGRTLRKVKGKIGTSRIYLPFIVRGEKESKRSEPEPVRGKGKFPVGGRLARTPHGKKFSADDLDLPKSMKKIEEVYSKLMHDKESYKISFDQVTKASAGKARTLKLAPKMIVTMPKDQKRCAKLLRDMASVTWKTDPREVFERKLESLHATAEKYAWSKSVVAREAKMLADDCGVE